MLKATSADIAAQNSGVTETMTRDQIQLSYGKLKDWLEINPVLLEGEIACVFDNTNEQIPTDIRIGNGLLRFRELPSVLTSVSTYTKTEVDELLDVIRSAVTLIGGDVETIQSITIPAIQESIEAIQALFDESATSENKLAALSTVRQQISSSIEARLGRLITAEGNLSFGNATVLQNGPYYYNGNVIGRAALRQGDKANVTDVAYPYYYDGAKWQPQSVVFTNAQTAALNSGVTSSAIQQISANTSAINTVDAKIANKADKYQAYRHNVSSVSYSGEQYSRNTLCHLFNGGDEVATAFILEDCSSSSPLVPSKLYVLNTTQSLPTTALSLRTDIGSDTERASTVVVSNELVTRNLSDAEKYQEEISQRFAETRLDKGPVDNEIRVIKNRKLEKMYTARTIVYVDGNYPSDQPEQGIEIAPYRTIAAALSSHQSNVALTVAPYSAGYTNTSNQLNLKGRTNTDIVGYAVGSQTPTIIKVPIVVGSDTETTTNGIGLRDLKIPSLTIRSGNNYYLENVTLAADVLTNTVVTIAETAQKVSFSHCTFHGKLVLSAGEIDFDSCDFAIGSVVEISGTAKVITRDCAGYSVTVKGLSTYIQESCILVKDSGNAIVAEKQGSNAPFVALLSGAALKSFTTDGSSAIYAPIKINTDVVYALGSFIYNKTESTINGARLAGDGLNANQIYADTPTEGYTASSNYLDAHLKGIAAKLKALSEDAGTLSTGVTSIEADTATTNGTIKLKGTRRDNKVDTNFTITATVKGLDSAAYKKEEDFAPASLATTVQNLGTTVGQHTTEIANLNSNKQTANLVTSLTAASDNDHYPSAKVVYDTVQGIYNNLNGKIDQMSSLGRILLPSDDASNTAFATFSALEAGPWYYSGSSVTPTEGDRALYLQNSIVYVGLYTATGAAALHWIEFYSTSSDLSTINTAIENLQTSVAALGDNKVNKTTTIAGVNLQNDITKAELLEAINVTEGAEPNAVTSVAGKTGAVTLVKGDVGLGSVDNTSDLDKPVSTATQTALDGKQNKIDSTHKLSADLVDDSEATNKFVTSEDKDKWNSIPVVEAADPGQSAELLEGLTITDAEGVSTTYKLPSAGADAFVKTAAHDGDPGGNSLVSFQFSESNVTQSYRSIADTTTSDVSDGYIPTVGKVNETLASYTTKSNLSLTTEPQGDTTVSSTEYVSVYSKEVVNDVTTYKLVPKKFGNVSSLINKAQGNSGTAAASAVTLASYTRYSFNSPQNNGGDYAFDRYPFIRLNAIADGAHITNSILDVDASLFNSGAVAETGVYTLFKQSVASYLAIPAQAVTATITNSALALARTPLKSSDSYIAGTTALTIKDSDIYLAFADGTEDSAQSYILYNSRLHLGYKGTVSVVPVIAGSDSVVYLENAQNIDASGLYNSTIYVDASSSFATVSGVSKEPGATNTVIYLSSKGLEQAKKYTALSFAQNDSVEQMGEGLTTPWGTAENPDRVIGGQFIANISVPYAKAATSLDSEPTVTVDNGLDNEDRKNADFTITVGNQTSAPVILNYANYSKALVTTTGSGADTILTLMNVGSNTTGGDPYRPVYISNGVPTVMTKYAGGTSITLNGTDKLGQDASFYAPTDSGNGSATEYLESNGSDDAPVWKKKQTIIHNTQLASGVSQTNQNDRASVPTTQAVYNALPRINTEDTTTHAVNSKIYAPDNSGSSGEILVSQGTGYAPVWGGFKRTANNTALSIGTSDASNFAEATLRITESVSLSGAVVNSDVTVAASKTLTISRIVQGCTITLEASSKIILANEALMQNCIIKTAVSNFSLANAITVIQSGASYTNHIAMFTNNLITGFTANTRPTVNGKGVTFGNWNGSVIF